MVENKSSLFGIIALIIGATGLGLGVFSAVNFQIVEGPEGPQGVPGEDGVDGIDGQDGIDGINGTDGVDGVNGEDAPGGIIVRILDPDYGEVVLGNIIIRALIYGSENYSLSILRNGTEIGTSLPTIWNTSTVNDGWWNISVIATDMENLEECKDEIFIYVEKNPIFEPSPGIVAVWEKLTCQIPASPEYKDIMFDDIRVNKSSYFTLHPNNSSIYLIQNGWYRFTIRFLWSFLDTGNTYWLTLKKDMAKIGELERHDHEMSSTFFYVNAVGYISSDGDDVLSFECSHSADVDGFQIYTGSTATYYNQLVLEYIGQ